MYETILMYGAYLLSIVAGIVAWAAAQHANKAYDRNKTTYAECTNTGKNLDEWLNHLKEFEQRIEHDFYVQNFFYDSGLSTAPKTILKTEAKAFTVKTKTHPAQTQTVYCHKKEWKKFKGCIDNYKV